MPVLLPSTQEQQALFFKRVLEFNYFSIHFKMNGNSLMCTIPQLFGFTEIDVLDIEKRAIPCKFSKKERDGFKGLQRVTSLEKYLPNDSWKDSILPYNYEFSAAEFEELFIKSNAGFTVNLKIVANRIFVNYPDLKAYKNMWFDCETVKNLTTESCTYLLKFISDDDADGNWAGEFFAPSNTTYVYSVDVPLKSRVGYFEKETALCVMSKK